MVLSLLVLLAAAPPDLAGADLALAEAEELLRLGLYREALERAEQAVALAPQSATALLSRGVARARVALDAPTRAALNTPRAGYDYRPLVSAITAARDDFKAALDLAAAADPLRARAAAELDAANRQLATAAAAAQQAVALAQQADVELQRWRREAGEAAVAKIARARQAAADVRSHSLLQYQWRYAAQRTGRIAGFTLLGLGLAAGGASVGTYVLSVSEVKAITAGGAASGAAIEAHASLAGTLRSVSLTTGLVGGAGLLVGLILVLANPTPPDFTGALAPVPGGASLVFSGVF